jgi:hypothetical protein
MRGLDPRIQALQLDILRLDTRVKPAYDASNKPA